MHCNSKNLNTNITKNALLLLSLTLITTTQTSYALVGIMKKKKKKEISLDLQGELLGFSRLRYVCNLSTQWCGGGLETNLLVLWRKSGHVRAESFGSHDPCI